MFRITKNKDPFTDYPKAPILQKSKEARSYATDNYYAVFGDYVGKVTMHSLMNDLLKANNYIIILCCVMEAQIKT